MQEELARAFHRAYPSSLRVADRKGRRLSFHYRAGREFWVDEDRTTHGRTVFGWLVDSDGERVGAMRFNEWHPMPHLPNEEFFWAMDEWSQASSNVAWVITDAWEVEELSQSGPVLEFSRLWMRPDHARNNVWALAAEALIRRRYRGRFSVMVGKAFPLEYEGAVPEGSPLERGFASRQRAMERLHARVLGAQPIPGDHGAQGWMWRPLSDHSPQPMRRARSRKRPR